MLLDRAEPSGAGTSDVGSAIFRAVPSYSILRKIPFGRSVLQHQGPFNLRQSLPCCLGTGTPDIVRVSKLEPPNVLHGRADQDQIAAGAVL